MTTKINLNDFASPFDAQHVGGEYEKEQYLTGRLLHSQEGWQELDISKSGCWSASNNKTGNGCLQAYERLAYHACVSYLVKGFMEAGGRVTFHGFRGITGQVTL